MRSLALLLFLSACASAPSGPEAPSGGVEPAMSGGGRVLYETSAEMLPAIRAAQVIDSLYAQVADRIGFRRQRELEVWMDPELEEPTRVFRDHIAMRPDAEVVDRADLYLAEAFVHWHAHGTALGDNLPHGVLVGLAQQVATELVPEHRAAFTWLDDELVKHTQAAGTLPRRFEQLGLGPEAWSRLDQRTRDEATAAAFFLIEGLGVDGLREQAEQGRVSIATLLRRAGVRPDGTGLPLLDRP